MSGDQITFMLRMNQKCVLCK